MSRALMMATALLALPVAGQAHPDPTGVPAHAVVTPLLQNEIEGGGAKEAALLLVTYAPGAVDPIHRHNALVYVYVLEGTVVMQVRGGPAVTLRPGQTFMEQPSDIHIVGRNGSKTKPAKFLAYFVKDKGAPPVVPAE